MFEYLMKSLKLQNFLEEPGASVLFLYFMGMGALDNILRASFNGVEHLSIPLFHVHVLLFALFFGVVLIIWKVLFSEYKIYVITRYYWILSLTPLLSYLLYGGVPENISSTCMVCLLLMVAMFGLIIGFRMSKLKGMVKCSAFAAFTVLLSIPIFNVERVSLVMGTSPSFHIYGVSVDLFLQTGWSEGLLINQQYHLMILILLGELVFVYFLMAYKFFYMDLINMIKTVKPFRTLHFIAMVILGMVFLRTVAPDEALSSSAINHIPFIILPIICLALAWQFATLINDRYDREIDKYVHPERPLVRSNVHKKRYDDLTVLTALSAVFFSVLLGVHIVLLVLLSIVLAILYSISPIRLRDRLYGHICVGLGSVIAFLTGIYSPPYWRYGISIYAEVMHRDIPLFPEIFQISLLILVVLSISPLINALSDYQGDLKSGVKNVYTVLGLEKGKRIVSILIFFLFISPAMWFNSIPDLLFMSCLGLLSSVVFYRYEDHRPVFGMYFIVLLYVMINLWNL